MYFCPKPMEWDRVYKALLSIWRNSGGVEPPRPLILNGWVFSSAAQKHDRWAETVSWATCHGCREIVESIDKSDYTCWSTSEE